MVGSKHTMSGGFESTDTPDFFDDDEYSRKAAEINFTDGIMGSQAGGRKPKSNNPGVEGALDVNPDIYVPEAEASRAGEMVFELKPSGQIDQTFEITCDSIKGTDLVRSSLVRTSLCTDMWHAGAPSVSHTKFPADLCFPCANCEASRFMTLAWPSACCLR